jgi:hypothetical protein
MNARRFLCFLVAALAASPPARANYCSEPSAPSCLSYGDINQFCRQQVDDYLRAIAAHSQCVIDSDQKLTDETIRKWNCRAAGHDICF